MYPQYSSHSDLLLNITNSFSLGLLYPTNPIPTRYLDNDQISNSVIDLMFFRYRLVELDNHTIYPEWRLLLDHASLTVIIPIEEQHSENQRRSITKGSEKEKLFIKDLIKEISSTDTFNLSDTIALENVIESFASTVKWAWDKNSKIANILRHSKSWWNLSCSKNLKKYRSTQSLADWKQFEKIIKCTKHLFFYQKIQEISNKTRELWELIN